MFQNENNRPKEYELASEMDQCCLHGIKYWPMALINTASPHQIGNETVWGIEAVEIIKKNCLQYHDTITNPAMMFAE